MSLRVLAAEDEALLSRQLVQALGEAGYAVDCALDGEQADFLIRTEEYDVVVLDLGLPKMPRPENLWVSLWLGGQSNMRRNACWRGFRDGTRHSSASPFFRSQFFSTDNGLRCGV